MLRHAPTAASQSYVAVAHSSTSTQRRPAASHSKPPSQVHANEPGVLPCAQHSFDGGAPAPERTSLAHSSTSMHSRPLPTRHEHRPAVRCAAPHRDADRATVALGRAARAHHQRAARAHLRRPRAKVDHAVLPRSLGADAGQPARRSSAPARRQQHAAARRLRALARRHQTRPPPDNSPWPTITRTLPPVPLVAVPVRGVSAPLLLLFAAPVAISTAPLTERALTAAAVRMLKLAPDVKLPWPARHQQHRAPVRSVAGRRHGGARAVRASRHHQPPAAVAAVRIHHLLSFRPHRSPMRCCAAQPKWTTPSCPTSVLNSPSPAGERLPSVPAPTPSQTTLRRSLAIYAQPACNRVTEP